MVWRVPDRAAASRGPRTNAPSRTVSGAAASRAASSVVSTAAPSAQRRASGEWPNPFAIYLVSRFRMETVQKPLPGITLVVAPNPSPLTLGGTNTWVVDGWVVDPGPADAGHLARVREAAGPIEGVVLTHSHLDHSEGADALGADVVLPGDGERIGRFEAIGTPGHSPDSVCLLHERILFTGDTVLGEGSVFIAPGEGSLSSYLESLEKLLTLELDAICPGHGPVVRDPAAKLREYRDHR